MSDIEKPFIERRNTPMLNGRLLLNQSVKWWFIVAVLGQWIFGLYVLVFYGTNALHGDFQNWNKAMPHGYVRGDVAGNMAVAIHLLFAIIVIGGGPLQIIPQIRARAKKFHRILGRIYIGTVLILSVSGLFMLWGRGTMGDTFAHLASTCNALYIITFAILTIRYAMKRDIKNHRVFALRLFLMANSVWFSRVLLRFWLLINGGPVGFDMETFTGPVLTIFNTIVYVVPIQLVLLELYLRAQKSQNNTFKTGVAITLVLFTVLMAVGIYAAATLRWLPKIVA